MSGTIHHLTILTLNDSRLVGRDPLLKRMLFVPLVYVAMLRWLLPAVAGWLSEYADITPYYPLFVSYILVATVPLIFGVVTSFILLEERDEGTLAALRVTPLPPRDYLLHRALLPMLCCAPALALSFALTCMDGMTWNGRFAVAAAASFWAPLTGLFTAALAENKIQGFALLKLVGIFQAFPLAAYFVPMPWQLAFGVVPIYWPLKMHWMLIDGAGPVWPCFAAGALLHIICIILLMKIFIRRAG
ncbi:MAG: hypothetical protein GC154_11320 [bacterium]|nr:hypothetical protein [bacterium]